MSSLTRSSSPSSPPAAEGIAMDSEGEPPPPANESATGRCSCGCLCCGSSSEWHRAAAKRRHEHADNPAEASQDVVRVEAEIEVTALRETLMSHQMSVQELYMELEEERSASSSAASEALSMILRLQREKAEVQMEARQFKRLAEEKMAHDQQEMATLEDLLFKREQTVLALESELQAYKRRLAANDVCSEPQTPRTPQTPASVAPPLYDVPEYPPIRCVVPTADYDIIEDGSIASPTAQTPSNHLQSIEHRIHQLERSPSYASVMEKAIVGCYNSPRRTKHHRSFSYESFGSGSFRRGYLDESPHRVDPYASAGENDYVNDRVYTIDAVHGEPMSYDNHINTFPGFNVRAANDIDDDTEVKRLYMRLQALEADRESMKQAIMSMSTDKAQMVLLKEIAQHLCKEVTPKKAVIKKTSFIRSFSIVAAFKWIISHVFWWKKQSLGVRYTFGLTNNNAGLLLLLEKTPRSRPRSFFLKTTL